MSSVLDIDMVFGTGCSLSGLSVTTVTLSPEVGVGAEVLELGVLLWSSKLNKRSVFRLPVEVADTRAPKTVVLCFWPTMSTCVLEMNSEMPVTRRRIS